MERQSLSAGNAFKGCSQFKCVPQAETCYELLVLIMVLAYRKGKPAPFKA
jgi:hypothetical protein